MVGLTYSDKTNVYLRIFAFFRRQVLHPFAHGRGSSWVKRVNWSNVDVNFGQVGTMARLGHHVT